MLLWYVVHLIAHRNSDLTIDVYSGIDSVFISCYKIQYVFGSPCPFASVFLNAESTAVGRILWLGPGLALFGLSTHPNDPAVHGSSQFQRLIFEQLRPTFSFGGHGGHGA